MAKGKYDQWISPEGLIRVEGWARDGLTDEQIAKNMGISRSTLSAWKERYSDISDALKKGKEVVDRQVENALLKRAIGYRYTEVVRETRYDMAGIPYQTSRTIEKEMPPDTTAIIFWLKNRKPEAWRDRQIEIEADKDFTIKINGCTDYGA